jgi:hypothetical protein
MILAIFNFGVLLLRAFVEGGNWVVAGVCLMAAVIFTCDNLIKKEHEDG